MSIGLLDAAPQLGLPASLPAMPGLNISDRIMLSVDRALHFMGFPGFETQTVIWLDDAVDAERLQLALTRLQQRHPLVTARLTFAQEEVGPQWQARPHARLPLHEMSLDSDAPEAVLKVAGEILSSSNDPVYSDPIRFHLLHRPNGEDVIVIHYNHTLMDNRGTLLLLKELQELFAAPPKDSAPAIPRTDPLRDHLKRIPWQRRKQAAQRTIALWRKELAKPSAKLGHAGAIFEPSPKVQIATRRVNVRDTAAFDAEVTRVCGFANPSMALLASVFRGIKHFSGPGSAGQFSAGIGVDVGVRGKSPGIFQNLMSVVPIRAPLEDMDDRDRLMRALSRQFRQRLANDIDLGVLQLTSVFSRQPRRASWAIELMLRYSFSLWYAYFGALDAIGDQFLGAGVKDIYYTGPCWAPVGLTLLVNRFRDQLYFQATYLPDLVSPALADNFLSRIIGDATGTATPHERAAH